MSIVPAKIRSGRQKKCVNTHDMMEGRESNSNKNKYRTEVHAVSFALGTHNNNMMYYDI